MQKYKSQNHIFQDDELKIMPENELELLPVDLICLEVGVTDENFTPPSYHHDETRIF